LCYKAIEDVAMAFFIKTLLDIFQELLDVSEIVSAKEAIEKGI
jgi:hypothetical protein